MPRSERDWWRKPPTIVGCGVAVLSVAAATIGTRWLGVQIAPTPLFFCAVMLSAWFGGVWPGLLATALSMLAVAYYFIPPINSFAIRVEYIPAFVLFSASALFVGWLSAKQRSAAQSLTLAHDERDAKVRELESSNDALQAGIAERERVEGSLRESEARLRALVGSIDEIVFEFDADGRYLNIWTSDESLLVRPRSELIGRLAGVLGEKEAAPYLETFRRVLASGEAESLEYPLQVMAGRRWFLARISPITSADGSCRTVCFLARDITERKRGEQRRAAQHAITRALAESDTLAAATPHLLRAIGQHMEWDWGAFWSVDRRAGQLRCDSIWHAPNVETAEFDAISRELALTPGQGRPGEVWHSAQPTWMVDATKEPDFLRASAAARAGLHGAIAFPFLLGGEALGVVEFFSRAVREPDEVQLGMLSAIGSQIGQFIKRKRAEDALLESEKRFRALIEHGYDVVFLLDAQGTVLYASPSLERVLGYTPEELVGRNGFELLRPDELQDAMSRFARLLDQPGRIVTGERLTRHRDGSWRWVDSAATNLLHEPGGQAVVVNARDVTERKQAEEALHHARAELAHIARVTTLGELTASIAHEINQPLAAIVTDASACLRWLKAPSPNRTEVQQSLARIIKDGNRASEVIDRIRALAKKSPTRKDRLDIREVILDVIALTRSEVQRNRVSLRTQLSDDLPMTEGDRIQLQQVILNLIINAIEAMGIGGGEPRELLVTSEKDGSQNVLVSVRDSGAGLDPESVDHIFDAFYTTKPSGMGMGLAISRSIIEAHGGRLWPSANAPRGAIFQFSLPSDRADVPSTQNTLSPP